jgi:hypothetical protein
MHGSPAHAFRYQVPIDATIELGHARGGLELRAKAHQVRARRVAVIAVALVVALPLRTT